MNLEPGIEVALFDAASRIEDATARRIFIEWVFRDSPEEAQRMNSVLGAEDAAESWFERAAGSLAGLATEIATMGSLGTEGAPLESAEIDDLSHSVAGRYTIHQSIGGGSGGQVFLAEQIQPVRRWVAIKLLRSGLEAPVFLAAFQREQQILAAMNHPNIAAILDAGTTFSGRPFLVMEFVEGMRITDYCEAHRLSIRQRLDLFLQVCSGIQHAHQKGIIHRDIKPSNVLITHANSRPLPKVIDFGIACVGEGVGEAAEISGTPAYMSPEQATTGGGADTLADVFGLGVVLYELLAGPPPWAPRRLERIALPVSARFASLPVPLRAAFAGARRLTPRDLGLRLRGDLDAIVAKAIALERRQRYDTVDNLASDILRHLGRFPVIARPPSARYSASCFLARNRPACLAGVAVLLSMIVGTAISVRYSFSERRARGEAEQARAKTAELLTQSSARENITQAAILLEQNRVEEADALLKRTPLSAIDPSKEAAYVFRFLGERSAMLGRWREAAECFNRLMIVNRRESGVSIARNNDLLYAAPAMLEAGDTAAYEALRANILERFTSTNDPVAAEHMVKSCLLTAPPRQALKQLEAMVETFRVKYKGSVPQGSTTYREWFALATVMFDLRAGRHQSAHDDASRALGWVKMPSCRASILLIRGLAGNALGQNDAARRDLAEASKLIQKGSLRVIVEDSGAYDLSEGSWYAWAVARILQREATAVINR